MCEYVHLYVVFVYHFTVCQSLCMCVCVCTRERLKIFDMRIQRFLKRNNKVCTKERERKEEKKKEIEHTFFNFL